MNISKRIIKNYNIVKDDTVKDDIVKDDNNTIINQWDEIVKNHNQTFIKAITSNDENILFNFLNTRNKNGSFCEWGFDNNDSEYDLEYGYNNHYYQLYVTGINYLLKRNNISSTLTIENINQKINEHLDLLDNIFDFYIDFKTFDFENVGFMTKRGNLTHRKLYALIHLWFIKKSLGGSLKNKKIIEIGGGNGLTAYFAYLSGVSEYIIVDIKTTQIIQFWNLSFYIKETNVSFLSENINTIVKLYDTKDYNYLYNKNYDIVFNADGLVEYGIKIAYNYFENFDKISKYFLSINHEDNFLYAKNYNDISYTFKNFFNGDIDWNIYINKYDDLKIVLRTQQDAMNHYILYGKSEMRTPNLLKKKKI